MRINGFVWKIVYMLVNVVLIGITSGTLIKSGNEFLTLAGWLLVVADGIHITFFISELVKNVVNGRYSIPKKNSVENN
jgi:ABC-type polysaccharide/polyol phosphate export permease